jgi:hypothetical protein
VPWQGSIAITRNDVRVLASGQPVSEFYRDAITPNSCGSPANVRGIFPLIAPSGERMNQRTWSDMIARSIEILKQDGARGLWFRLLAKTSYRRMFLFDRALREPGVEVTSPPQVAVDLLKLTEIQEYMRARPGNVGEILNRLNNGHMCFLVRYSNSIVHTCWVGVGTAHMGYLDCEIEMAPGVVYVYGSFTNHAHRNMNLATLRGVFMERHLFKLGFHRAVAVIVPENKAALRRAQKGGYGKFGLIGFLAIGSWRRYFCRALAEPGFKMINRTEELRTGSGPLCG